MNKSRHKPGVFFFLLSYTVGCVVVLLLPLPAVWKIVISLFLAVPGYGIWFFLFAREVSDSAPSATVFDGSVLEKNSGDLSLAVPVPQETVSPVSVVPVPEANRGIEPDSLRVLLPIIEAIKDDYQNLQSLYSKLGDFKMGADFIKENVQRSFEISDNLANSAKQAFELSEQVQKGVMVVTNALAESLKQTLVLFEYSKKIAMILEIMSEISEKIHILSINASIVSARAGALGRGFEVVAKEIRLLAKETEHSLGDIESVISELKTTVNTVTRVVREADKETEQEKSALMSVAGSLQGVVLGVEIVRAVSSMAKEKSEEQSQQLALLLSQFQVQNGITKLEDLKSRLHELTAKE